MNKNCTRSGIGFSGLLTTIFIVLKALKVIDWPWVWVLAPTWVPVAMILTVLAVVAVWSYIKGL